MIKKKRCNNCDEKVKKSYSFCPNCGISIGSSNENMGMLGKNDSIENQIPKLFSGIGGGMMNKMLGNAIKMLESEMNKELNALNKQPKTKFKLMINGKEVNSSNTTLEPNENAKILPIEFSKSNLEKWRSLKKIEPKSNLKRVENQIKYNIEIPEVDSIKDISIIKLENSLEVRAIGKKTGYIKNISIDLPLKKYSLLKGILTLEMDAE